MADATILIALHNDAIKLESLNDARCSKLLKIEMAVDIIGHIRCGRCTTTEANLTYFYTDQVE